MKSVIQIYSIFATLSLFSAVAFAQDINHSKDLSLKESGLGSSGKSLCFASQVRVSNKGEAFYLLNRNSYIKYGEFDSLSGASVDYYNWKNNINTQNKLYGVSVRGEKTKYGKLSLDSRNLSFDNNGNLFAKSYFEGGSFLKYNKEGQPDFIKLYNTYGFGSNFSYFNLINFNNIENDLSSIKNDIDNEKNSIFFKTKTFDGLNSITLLDDEIYKIGSKNGRNLVLKLPNGRIINIDEDIDAISFSNLHITKDVNDKLLLASNGLIKYVYSVGNINKNSENKFYAQYITYPNGKDVDLAYDKKSLWKITETNSIYFNELEREITKWVEKGWIIKSVSGDKESGHFALLFENNIVDNNNSLVIFDIKENKKKYFVCDVDETKKMNEEEEAKIAFMSALGKKTDIDLDPHLNINTHHEIPVTGYSVKFKAIGTDGKQVILRISTKLNKNKIGTLISFRGGPMVNLFTFGRSDYNKKLLDEGWEIIEPEYSGAVEVSPTISSRLRKDLKNALSHDVFLIKNYLKAAKVDDKPLIILGGSWGSFEAIELASKIKTKKQRLILLAPASEFNDPSKSITNKNLDYFDDTNVWIRQVKSAYGMPFDEAGNDANVVFKNIILKTCNMKNAKLLFGKEDNVVNKQPWLDLCKSPLPIIEIPNQLHSMSGEYNNQIINTAHELLE